MLDIVNDDPENLLALLDGRVMVQLRYGRLSTASLDVAAARILPVLESEARAVGAIAVVNADAGVMPAEVQARQQVVIGNMLSRPNAFMVTVMFGESVQATAMRAVGRVLMLGKRTNIRHAKTVEEAATWLGERLGDITPAALKSSIDLLEKRRKP